MSKPMSVRANVLGRVVRREVEVAAGVDELGGGQAVLHREEEELELGAGVEGETHLGRLGDGLPEDVARVALERLAAVGLEVADKARDAPVLGPPGQDRVGGRVGLEEHVRLLDPGEPLDGGAVKPDPLGQGLLGLRRGDGDVLWQPLDIRELEPDELHQVGVYPLEQL
jgi:hypothetical protein